MAMSSAVAGSASAQPPTTTQLQSGPPGGDPNGDLSALASQLREIGQSVDAVAQSNPDLAQQATQIKNLLRQMIVAKAQTASMQTPSAQALPMGGQ
jgi:hypothetical protein